MAPAVALELGDGVERGLGGVGLDVADFDATDFDVTDADVPE